MFYSNQNDLNAHDMIITKPQDDLKAAYCSYQERALFIVTLQKLS